MFENEYNMRDIQLIKTKGSLIKMFVTPRYTHHYVNNEYEPFTTEIIKNYLRKEDTFVDVGAHFGYYSLLAHNIHPNSSIISVEPIKLNFQILQKNIHLNKIKKIKLYNLALSDTKGKKEINITEASDSAGFYEHPLAKTISQKIVTTKTGDELFFKIKSGFIKIDVEGHEIPVLKGLQKTLKNENVRLIIEFNPKCQKQAGFQPQELLNLLDDLNFETYLIDDAKRKMYRLTSNDYTWEKFMDPENSSYTNMYCTKKDKSLYAAYFSHSATLWGAEKSLLDLLSQIKKYGVLNHVIFPEEKGLFIDTLKNKGIGHSYFYFNRWTEDMQLHKENYISSLQNLNGIIEELKMLNPHVVYTNTSVIPWGAVSSLLASKPHIWHINEFVEKDHGMKFVLGFEETAKLISALSQKVIYNSYAIANEYNKFTDKTNNEVIYYNIPSLSLLAKEKVLPIYQSNKSLKLIIVGLIARSKGQEQIVKAVIDLIKKGYQIELLILGSIHREFDYLKKINSLISENGVNGIYIKKYVKNPYPYINQSDVLIVCSQMEAFGRVSLEAMRLKKPVIASDRGANIELVQKGYNGLLYEYDNNKDLQKKILYFYTNRKEIKRIGKNGYIFAKKNFTEQGYVGNTLKVFTKYKNHYTGYEKTKENLLQILNEIFQKRKVTIPDEVKNIVPLSQTQNTEKQNIEKIEQDNELLLTDITNIEREIDSLSQSVNMLKNAKFYKLWQLYCSVKNKFKI